MIPGDVEGVAGLGVQPSELAKLVAIFFIAALLERRMHRIDDVRYAVAPIAIVVIGLVGLILAEPDFGTSMSLAAIAVVMVFAAGPVHDLLGAARGSPALTVTDVGQDAPEKGIINFVIADNRVRFEIDDRAAAQAGFTISSKLLSLALSIKPRN